MKPEVNKPVNEHEVEHDPDESGAAHRDTSDRECLTRLIALLNLSSGNDAEDDAHDRPDPVEPDDAQDHRRDGETVRCSPFANDVHGLDPRRDKVRRCWYFVRKRVDAARGTKSRVVTGWVSIRAVHISPIAWWPLRGRLARVIRWVLQE